MHVNVRLFAMLRETMGTSQISIDAPDGVSVAQLLESLQQKYPPLAGRCTGTVVAINEEYVQPTATLRPGDEVALIPPVSGGAVANRISVGVTSDVLDAAEISKTLRRSTNGAVLIFEGIVRDNNLGRQVLYLEYESYKTMCEKVLREIGERVTEQFHLDDIALWHRVGRLEIGETSLVVAVGSPHRREGFEACIEAVEQVKALAPVWKKEVWEGGSEWLGGAG